MNQLHLAHANTEISRRLADAASRRRVRRARRRPPATRHLPFVADRRG